MQHTLLSTLFFLCECQKLSENSVVEARKQIQFHTPSVGCVFTLYRYICLVYCTPTHSLKQPHSSVAFVNIIC